MAGFQTIPKLEVDVIGLATVISWHLHVEITRCILRSVRLEREREREGRCISLQYSVLSKCVICPDLVHIQLSLLKSTQVYPLIHWSICIYHMRVRNRVPKSSVPQTVLSLLNCHNWTHTPLSNTSNELSHYQFYLPCYPHQFPVVTSPEHILKILLVRMSPYVP